jgi:hypothetical protein
VATGREIRTFVGHIDDSVAAFSPDGNQILSGSYDGTIRLWGISTGRELAQFISLRGADTQLAAASRGLTVETVTTTSSIDGEWLAITPDGYYQASPRGDRYLNVRIGNTVSGIDAYRSIFYNPDVVQARLQGKPDPVSTTVTIQQAASFTPPTVTIQSPANFSATNTRTANLSVNVASQSRPVRNVRVFVNGYPIGGNELAAARGEGLQAERTSLTVTGSRMNVSVTLPVLLEPGPNRIEVVAFNQSGVDTRRYVDVTWNAPAAERPPLPNLWILAVGVNGYSDSGIRNLNFCVADAKGVVDSLKAQEGRAYGKVNTLLIADGEALAPTAENIRRNLGFLGQAANRDTAILFLAGHGVSRTGGKFYFLPRDAALNGNAVDESRAISGDDIMTVLEGLGRRLVFIDACQSGGMDNDRMTRALMESNAFVFTSSQGTELSWEDPDLGHGFFTDSILTAIKGAPAALSEGRNVSVLSMSGFVRTDVPKRVLQKYGQRQNPGAYSLGSYDFPLAVIR